MRKLSINLLAFSLLSLFSIWAYGDDKGLKEHVTISKDVMVGNTNLKKGDYLVKYDASTGEVTFTDRGKRKVVATAKATVKMNDKKAESDAVYTKVTPTGEMLLSLRLGGQREELIFNDTTADSKDVPIATSNTAPRVDMKPALACDWEAVPISEDLVPLNEDMDGIFIPHVNGFYPDAIVNYKWICHP